MVNYDRKLKMEVDIKKKEKIKKAIEFSERIKKMQKEVEAAWRKA